jgi:hypothetical protein
VTARLPETYQWLLVPTQATPQAPITWPAIRLSGGDALAVRASKKLRSDESLVISLGSTILRKHLDDVPLWRGDHVPVRQLVDDFARYLYLPRLAGSEVLVNAIRSGLALLTWQADTFAFAEGFDEAARRYQGLQGGQQVAVMPDRTGLLVKPELARRQFDAEVPERPARPKRSRIRLPIPAFRDLSHRPLCGSCGAFTTRYAWTRPALRLLVSCSTVEDLEHNSVHRPEVAIDGTLANFSTVLGTFFDRFAEVEANEDARIRILGRRLGEAGIRAEHG